MPVLCSAMLIARPCLDEIINTFLIPQMFAEVVQGKRTPEEAARVFDRSFGGIFQRWRNLGKI
jgi:hypothetical protein